MQRVLAVTSSATIETSAMFVGTILALVSISAQSEATIAGRLLARTGEVTLMNNTVATPPHHGHHRHPHQHDLWWWGHFTP
ncbi:hypothetical protein BH23ACT5_BH23ACT5_19950 [soil metagenome]